MIVGDKKENKRLLILVTIVIVIFLGFTVVAYVGMETALTYSWDNAGYPKDATPFTSIISRSISGWDKP